MRKSTIKLTKHELNFAKDTSYPLAKKSVVQKIALQLNQLGKNMQAVLNANNLFDTSEYKITRGENYKHMPYLMLDSPKLNGANFKIACRTMFWWGHYFSCNLFIKTECLNTAETASLLQKLPKAKIWIGDNLWEQELSSGEYVKVNTLTQTQIEIILQKQPYLKLSAKIAINKVEQLPTLACKIYSYWLSQICIKKGA